LIFAGKQLEDEAWPLGLASEGVTSPCPSVSRGGMQIFVKIPVRLSLLIFEPTDTVRTLRPRSGQEFEVSSV
jgi:hypothetical protein